MEKSKHLKAPQGQYGQDQEDQGSFVTVHAFENSYKRQKNKIFEKWQWRVFLCTSDFLKRQLASDKEFQSNGEGYRLSSARRFIVFVSVIVIVNSDFIARLRVW